ncbi:hypothetical protein TrST_g3080 [Triparma strigata]|uniref:Uncharacterized protein n=1 Tax=Triparma strigata TaxID=1606541 RepID=A0A9W7EGH0_9STRA|nr:hypothetical protein TrST_g3080 [Triparma strigata]
MSCSYPNCVVPGRNMCSRCHLGRYCSKEHQRAHFEAHQPLCLSLLLESTSKTGSPEPPGGFDELYYGPFRDEDNRCCICLIKDANCKLVPCGHSVTCRDCTVELLARPGGAGGCRPCPFCRKHITAFNHGRFIDTRGTHGLWPQTLIYFTNLVSGEGFSEYFQDLFTGNEESYLRWKVVFDMLNLVKADNENPSTPVDSLEMQVVKLMKGRDLVKLRALATLCSNAYFDDKTLLVATRKRITEVFGDPWKKENRNKMAVLDACCDLGRALDKCGGAHLDEGLRYIKRARAGYEALLGDKHAKTLGAIYAGIMTAKYHTGNVGRRKALEEVSERMIKHLGDEHPVTLLCLNSVGSYMRKERRCDDARKIHRKVLFSRLKAIGSEHIDTIDTMNNLGNNYHVGKDYSNAFEFYQTAINTFERTLGKTHPNTLMIVMNEAIIWFTLKNFAKAEAMLQRALDGYVAQFGKDHDDTARCVMNFKIALRSNRSKDAQRRLNDMWREYPEFWNNTKVHRSHGLSKSRLRKDRLSIEHRETGVWESCQIGPGIPRLQPNGLII